MMKYESGRMKVVEEVYTSTVMKITEDTIGVYEKISRWYDEMSNGNFRHFKRFMAVCKTV